MRIAVLGTGNVGRSLAAGFAGAGHEVTVGTRDPEATLARGGEFAEWRGEHPQIGLATLADAAAGAELVVNATSGSASIEALEAAGEGNLAGKVLVEVGNPLESTGTGLSLFVSNTDSLAERIQRRFPEAKVVKTLNTVNHVLMVEPGALADGEHTMFVAGDDTGAKETVTGLLRELGWRDVLDLGGIDAARGMEAYLLLWAKIWGAVGTPGFSIQVVRPG